MADTPKPLDPLDQSDPENPDSATANHAQQEAGQAQELAAEALAMRATGTPRRMEGERPDPDAATDSDLAGRSDFENRSADDLKK